MRMVSITALMGVVALAVTPADVSHARADYAHHAAQGIEVRYAWLPEMDPATISAFLYQVPATSREPLLDYTVPERVAGTNLWRMNLTALGWRTKDWAKVCSFQNNGYTEFENPLIVPMAWFVNELADCREGGNAYFTLLFQGKPPKTEDEFLATFGLSRKQQGVSRFGWVEGQSGVHRIKDGARIVEHLDGANSEGWSTYDVRKITIETDPLQSVLPEKLKYDASETFVLIPKVSAKGGKRGVMAVTGLFNGTGAVQVEAPNDIVADTTETFGNDLIINNGSCVSCHTDGPKMPSINALRDRLAAGLQLKTYEERKRIEAELYHLGDATTALERWGEDYTTALECVNGLTPLANAESYRAALKRYREDVDLNRAAAELSTDANFLKLAIAWANVRYIDAGVRSAGLAEGKTMTRDTFESEYLKLKSYLSAWSANQ